MTQIYAWHFLRDDGTAYGGYVPPPVGELEVVEGEIVLRRHGLHGSIEPLDALGYAQGPIVRRVVLSGDVEHGSDNLAASKRRAVWQADATPVLHEFACWCAERALSLIPEPDPHSLKAIEVKRLWLRGETTDAELEAAEAARAAAEAARAAARAAAAWAARAEAWVAAWDEQNKKLKSMLLTLGREAKIK